MSPVVQLLERTAIGSQFLPRAESTTSAHSLPGPPTPAGTSSPASLAQQASPAVMAYNPAAPAAPERIQYREKTPPPLDDGTGTGLGPVSKYDNLPVTQYANAAVPSGHQSSQPTPQSAYFSGPPQQAHHQPQQVQHQHQASGGHLSGQPSVYSAAIPPPPPPSSGPSPHPQQQQPTPGQYTPSFAGPPTSPPPHQQSFNRQSSYTGVPQSHSQQPTTQYASYSSSSFGPSIQSPGMPPTPSAPPAYALHQGLQSQGLPPPPPGGPPPQSHTPQPSSLQHHHSFPLQPQAPTHNYSAYNYTGAQQAPPLNQHGAYTGDVHNQAYRPTEAEAAHGHHKPEKQGNGKLEERIGGVEKKVGGFLKRLDKLL